jgi:hypothetical protein
MAVEREWWLLVTEQGHTPNRAAFKPPRALRFDTLADALGATVEIPDGLCAWILGDDVLFDPKQIEPIRSLMYRFN